MSEEKKTGYGGARPGSGRKARPNHKVLYLHLPVEVIDKIRQRAAERGMPLGDVVCECLRFDDEAIS